jgi:carbamoyltransferase
VKPRNYIGLANTVHDPALAIVDSRGEVVFAEAAERSLGFKRAFFCPPDDPMRVRELLDTYCEPGAELVVAHSWLERRWKSVLFRAGWHFTRASVSPLLRPTILGQMNSFDLASLSLDYRLHEADPARAPVEKRYFDHHLAHAAAAAFASPFNEAVCAIIDGQGETAPDSFFHYRGGGFASLRSWRWRSFSRSGSLGVFFAALCVACGFDPMKGEEWKVMGLAPYGQKDARLYGLMRGLLRVEGLEVLGNNWQIISKLHALKPPKGRAPLESRDVAFTGQLVFSEVAAELLRNLHRLGLGDSLVLSGGCALNSAFNGRVTEETPWKKVFVYCAPADDGNAVGAALLAHREDNPGTSPPAKVASPYLGSRLSASSREGVQSLGKLRNTRPAGVPVTLYAAQLIAQGKIVGWAQGRAEYGPRALGNRSILADPRAADVKDRLNATVKFREEFRPFAPSILHEHGAEWFEQYQDTPYMERALRFRPEMAPKVPGVVHVDGTGRLQSVSRELNPRYHELISHFYRLTGVPMVLNTSFNVMGKPIIHSVEDALAVFFSSGLDALVLEDDVYEKG